MDRSIIDLIGKRRSVREFSEREVEGELLDIIIEAGHKAPSAHNAKPWRFEVIKGEKKEQISDILSDYQEKLLFGFHNTAKQGALIIRNAPVVIAVWNKLPLSSRMRKISGLPPNYKELIRDFEIQSVSASVENIWLAAAGLGLGMAWLGVAAFCGNEISNLFNIQDEFIAVLALGYPKEKNDRQIA